MARVPNVEVLRRIREKLSAIGICLTCRQRKPSEGKKTCDECLKATREKKEWNVAHNLCPCGNKRARGRKRCRPSLDRESANRTKTRARRRANGLCSRCDLPAEPGRAECRRHLDLNNARMRRYNAKKRASDVSAVA